MYPVPLSITTAGREVAGSMRIREKEMSALKADLWLRSERLFRAEDHGREGQFVEREEEGGAGVSDGDADLDRKRKQPLNVQELVIEPPISTKKRSI